MLSLVVLRITIWALITTQHGGVLLHMVTRCCTPVTHCYACRYWGDFFFSKEQSLTFDGIFQLFPHPMYTVGYAAYYGGALCARSYTLLFTALVAHAMQVRFLLVKLLLRLLRRT